MKREVLYPELADYIYHYCSEFQTADELTAGRTLLYTAQANNSKMMLTLMQEKGWISTDPVILAMIADGSQAFTSRVAERVWREHKDTLPLNLCPNCHKIARTPQARQCRFCFHDWHDTSL